MNGNYVLDSNVIIDIFRGDAETIKRVSEIKGVYIPVIVIGELYFGANKSAQTPKRIAEIETLEKTGTILEITKSTARIYGEIKDQLRAKGALIPENDIWIAAITKEHNFTLITKDHHFEKVSGISIEKV